MSIVAQISPLAPSARLAPENEKSATSDISAGSAGLDSARIEWMATHVADIEWFPGDDGKHEQSLLWWAYDRDDRVLTSAIGDTPLSALRLAVDTAMAHSENKPAPRALPNK